MGTQNECLVTKVDNLTDHETFTIPRIAAYVPVIQPRSPNNIMATSFTMINTEGRLPSADSVNSSMIGGNIRASELLARAPIRAISKSRCGITMAIAPVNKISKIRKTTLPTDLALGLESLCSIFGHNILTGT